jgi:hypothetical protein
MTDSEYHKRRYEKGIIDTTDGKPPIAFTPGAPGEIGPNGQHAQYWVLSEAERAKGFVRPVRDAYLHATCGTVTTMGRALAETYARDPNFYGATMCVNCGGHFRVGPDGEFTWAGSTEKVGT